MRSDSKNMNPTQCKTHGCAIAGSRRGMVLVIVIVTMSICVVLFGLWARNLVSEQRRSVNQQYQMQAARLAEAGLRRVIARRRANPEFQDETWSVSAASLGGRHAATVQLRAVPTGGTTAIRYEATARYPADAIRRAQVTKHVEVPAPTAEGET